MRIGIIADTHDNVHAVEAAVDIFEQSAVDAIVHCGDVIAPPVIPLFDGVEFHLVLGNNDGEIVGLRSAIADLEPAGHCHGRFGVMEFDGLRLAALHGEDLADVDRYARSGAFDVVCYGHHHETRHEMVDGTTVINPGGHFPTVPDEHRRVVTVTTDDGSVDFHRV